MTICGKCKQEAGEGKFCISCGVSLPTLEEAPKKPESSTGFRAGDIGFIKGNVDASSHTTGTHIEGGRAGDIIFNIAVPLGAPGTTGSSGQGPRTGLNGHGTWPRFISIAIAIALTLAAGLYLVFFIEGKRPGDATETLPERHSQAEAQEIGSAKPKSTPLHNPPELGKPKPSPAMVENSESELEIFTDPSGCEAYLNWQPLGQTPARLRGHTTGSLLVVTSNTHQAGYQTINATDKGMITLALKPDKVRSRTRLLLLVSGGSTGDALSVLRGRLGEEGFTILGALETEEFRRELVRAGGVSHRGFRAWARSRFDTDLMLEVEVRLSSRDLGDQDAGYPGVKDAVKGAVRGEVSIDVEAVDLRSGEHVARASAIGSAFALDKDQALRKALADACAESARLLRERLRL